MKLKISKEISLPLDAVTQTIAAIGRKGAGKTYLASMIAEQMLDAEAQTIVIDPVGNWWGLRVGADGKSKGKEIFVIGGDHGDVPLIPEAGKKIAKLLVEKKVSAILDVSGFRIGEHKKFAAEFAEEFFHLKKSHRSPVHLFVEEAQKLIPQRVGPDEARMVGAFEQIVRLGRNYGIGCTLVTQRPQSVNKEVLSQVECLCVLQITGPHERKALEEWVQEVGADRKLIGELPGLARGEGYVWSPSWLRIFERVHFEKKTTFDASATPEVGKKTRAASISAVDVEALRADMAEVVEQAEKDNPSVLRKRIFDLEKELAKKNIERDLNKEIQVAVKEAEKRKDIEFMAQRDEFIRHINTMFKIIENVGKMVKDIKMPDLKLIAKKTGEYAVMVRPVKEEVGTHRKRLFASMGMDQEADIPNSSGSENGPMGEGERKTLIAIAQYDGTTREHLTILTGYKRSTRDAYIQRLKAKGYAEVRGDRVHATESGIEALGGDYERLPEGKELIEHYLRTLPEGEAKVFKILVENYGLVDSVDREEISEKTGFQRSTRDAYIQRLKARQLIEVVGRGGVMASRNLFSY